MPDVKEQVNRVGLAFNERGLKFDDPALGIAWPDLGREFILSEKDTRHPPLKDIEPWG